MYKAILVDDEKIVRLALKTIVDWTALGYTVTGSYSSVKTALLEIEDDPPDLIITDIKMPDMVCSLSSRYGSKTGNVRLLYLPTTKISPTRWRQFAWG